MEATNLSDLNDGVNIRPVIGMLNLTDTTGPDDLPLMLTIGVLLIVLILACIIGNLFVIVAILIERDLKSRPQYYLIFSLAVADLLVGLIVTPLGAWSTVLKAWTLGVVLCDFWISVDVLVCTSSILHLVAIALDRYWSVTDVCYVQNRTPRRIFGMLGIIWVLSLLISLAPILGWKDSNFYYRVTEQHVCLISQQISYQVFSTSTAFYIPLCAIICIYYKIMRAAKKRFKRERNRRITSRNDSEQTEVTKKSKKFKNLPTTVLILSRNTTATTLPTPTASAVPHRGLLNGNSSRKQKNDGRTSDESEKALIDKKWCDDMQQLTPGVVVADKLTQLEPNDEKSNQKRKGRNKENSEMKRERKAWRTLAIITGTFVACWTPFFLVSLYRPICACKIPILVESITNWLGYLNSALNPIIYTLFSRDFRAAFKRILARMLFMKRQW